MPSRCPCVFRRWRCTSSPRLFLELKERWPLGDRISIAFIVFYALVGVASFWVDYRTSVQLGTYGVFPGVLAVVCTRPIRRSAAATRRRGCFCVAWTMLLFGTAMYASVSFGLLQKNFFTEYGIQIGSAVEMILLSFALAYRYASLRTENERIVREANEQLERNVARRTSELSTALEQLAEANSRLRESNRRDALTGLFNRRHFREMFDHLLQPAPADTRQPLGVLLIDLDYFKQINDDLRPPGRRRMPALARRASLRRQPGSGGALLARFGGEEFVVVLPGGRRRARAGNRRASCGSASARERVRYAGREIAMTASIGVFSVPAGTGSAPTRSCTRPTTRCTRPRTPDATASTSPDGVDSRQSRCAARALRMSPCSTSRTASGHFAVHRAVAAHEGDVAPQALQRGRHGRARLELVGLPPAPLRSASTSRRNSARSGVPGSGAPCTLAASASASAARASSRAALIMSRR